MADPIIKRIDEHPNLVGVAAIDDKVLGIDASQANLAQKTVLIAMNQLSIHTPSQLAANVVEGTQIKNGAVTPDKLSIPYIPDNVFIELGNLRTSSGSAYIDFHPYYPLNDYDARIIASGGEASTNAKGTLTYYAVSHVFNGDLSVSGEITGAKHVVYMQLFLPDEAIITASGRSQFFVPSYLAGGKVKQLGIGIVSASTPSVSVALGSSYGSVSGTSSTETADTLNYTLPSARTKIPINVTCGAGTAPKGLDFWFVVLK